MEAAATIEPAAAAQKKWGNFEVQHFDASAATPISWRPGGGAGGGGMYRVEHTYISLISNTNGIQSFLAAAAAVPIFALCAVH